MEKEIVIKVSETGTDIEFGDSGIVEVSTAVLALMSALMDNINLKAKKAIGPKEFTKIITGNFIEMKKEMEKE